jgi:hypothetical protein
MRKSPTPATLKALFAKSGNQCAFPNCTRELVNDRDLFVGEACHINAVRKLDARYDDRLDENALRARDNLILLCHEHHRIIDSFEEEFPSVTLREMRLSHEKRQGGSSFVPSDVVLGDAVADIVRDEWMPYMEQLADYLTSDVVEYRGGQQGVNLASGLITAALDAEIYFEVLRLAKLLPGSEHLNLINEQDAWEVYRHRCAEASVESHGGSLAPYEYNSKCNELARRGLKNYKNAGGAWNDHKLLPDTSKPA